MRVRPFPTTKKDPFLALAVFFQGSLREIDLKGPDVEALSRLDRFGKTLPCTDAAKKNQEKYAGQIERPKPADAMKRRRPTTHCDHTEGRGEQDRVETCSSRVGAGGFGKREATRVTAEVTKGRYNRKTVAP